MRGGAAAPTGLNEQALLTTPPDERVSNMGQTKVGLSDQYQLQGKHQASRTGGGHRGTFQRFGNDEVKPDDMKQEALWNDSPSDVADRSAGIHKKNACKNEQQFFYNCLNDNKKDIDIC